jgi:catechol 2,3-dioxygenase
MAIDPRVDIGHVHLKVSDIDRALGFYRDILGFEEMQRYGDQAAFISAGGYHHHIGLNTWESKGGSPPPQGTTGLYHVAIRYPDRKALGQALKQLVEAGVPIGGATDHGVSEAIYLRDPDDNGIELYRDRPRDEWPRPPDGSDGIAMYTKPFDLQALLAWGVSQYRTLRLVAAQPYAWAAAPFGRRHGSGDGAGWRFRV